jgi:hypothetical protein
VVGSHPDDAAAAGWETKARKDSPSVVRRELGAVQSSHHLDHLLGRIPTLVYDHEMVLQRLGQDPAQATLYFGGAEREPPAGDHYCMRRLWHGFSVPSLRVP